MARLWLGAVLALTTGAAAAGEAQDRIFAMNALGDAPTGTRVVYDHDRSGSFDPAALTKIEDGTVELAVIEGEAGARQVQIAMQEGEAAERRFQPHPVSAGNPLLMVFMETNVRAMAAVTGGSPFYIRNRMREALRVQDERQPAEIVLDGATVPAERVIFRPFAEDPNRESMGAFAALEISFTVSDAVPGGYAALEAVTGPGPDGAAMLAERIVVERVETAE